MANTQNAKSNSGRKTDLRKTIEEAIKVFITEDAKKTKEGRKINDSTWKEIKLGKIDEFVRNTIKAVYNGSTDKRYKGYFNDLTDLDEISLKDKTIIQQVIKENKGNDKLKRLKVEELEDGSRKLSVIQCDIDGEKVIDNDPIMSVEINEKIIAQLLNGNVDERVKALQQLGIDTISKAQDFYERKTNVEYIYTKDDKTLDETFKSTSAEINENFARVIGKNENERNARKRNCDRIATKISTIEFLRAFNRNSQDQILPNGEFFNYENARRQIFDNACNIIADIDEKEVQEYEKDDEKFNFTEEQMIVAANPNLVKKYGILRYGYDDKGKKLDIYQMYKYAESEKNRVKDYENSEEYSNQIDEILVKRIVDELQYSTNTEAEFEKLFAKYEKDKEDVKNSLDNISKIVSKVRENIIKENATQEKKSKDFVEKYEKALENYNKTSEYDFFIKFVGSGDYKELYPEISISLNPNIDKKDPKQVEENNCNEINRLIDLALEKEKNNQINIQEFMKYNKNRDLAFDEYLEKVEAKKEEVITEIKADYDKKIENLKQQQRNEIENIKEEYENKYQQLSEAQNEEIKRKIDEVEQYYKGELERVQEEYEKEKNNYTLENINEKEKNNQLQQQNDELNKQIEDDKIAYESNINELTKKNEDNEKEFEAKKQEYEKIIDSQTSNIENLEKYLEDKNNKNEELKRNLEDQEKENNILTAENIDLKAKEKEQEEKLDNLTEENIDLKTKYEEQTQKLNRLTEEKFNLKEELANIKDEYEVLQEEKKYQETELAILKEKLRDNNDENEIRDGISKVEKTLREVKEDIQKLKGDVNNYININNIDVVIEKEYNLFITQVLGRSNLTKDELLKNEDAIRTAKQMVTDLIRSNKYTEEEIESELRREDKRKDIYKDAYNEVNHVEIEKEKIDSIDLIEADYEIIEDDVIELPAPETSPFEKAKPYSDDDQISLNSYIEEKNNEVYKRPLSETQMSIFDEKYNELLEKRKVYEEKKEKLNEKYSLYEQTNALRDETKEQLNVLAKNERGKNNE